MLAKEVIIKKADALTHRLKTRDPHELAAALGIIIMERPFKKLKGAYKVIQRNRFIFLRSDLDEDMKRIVLWHELGHDQLHRAEASDADGFAEFDLFDMRKSRMEYEANVFAAQLAHSDEEVLELCYRGYDTEQIASALRSDINLIALKADNLITKGYDLKPQEHRNDFLK